MQKTNLWLLGAWKDKLGDEIGIRIYTLLYVKQVTNKDLLWSTGSLQSILNTQYSVYPIWEQNLKKSGHMHTYI